MMRCQRAAELISWDLDTRLPMAQRVGVRIHTAVCGSCRRFRRQLATIDAIAARFMSKGMTWDRPTIPSSRKDALRATIIDRLGNES